MKFIFKTINFLAPEITLYHKGELFHYSIVSGIISLICIILIIISIVYFSRPFIWRKNPTTYIFESYADKQNAFSINSTSFVHLITMTSYNLSDLIEFDYYAFRVVGMQTSINIYTEIYNKDLSSIDHWLYGPCDIENYIKNDDNYLFFNEIINNCVCINKFYDSKKRAYYNINDSNFQWPHTKYDELGASDDYYSIVVEKCEEDTLNEILGKGNYCKNDSEINSIIESGKWISFSFLDYYVNLKEYDNPDNTYFRSLENRLHQNVVSINKLNFNPITIKTNRGYVLDNFEEKIFYEFDNNENIQEAKENIYYLSLYKY